MTDSTTTLQPPSAPAISSKHILYPPGGLLIWSLVLMELFTFGVALVVFAYSANNEPEAFHQSRLLLNPTYGVINTVFLLVSGYFMAVSLGHFKRGNQQLARQFMRITMLGGVLFLTLKSVEYYEKLSHGLDLSYDTFFTYYWLLTSFHVMHVLVGLVILFRLSLQLKRPKSNVSEEDFEAGATFWHMCDIIWLILFPVMYLLV